MTEQPPVQRRFAAFSLAHACEDLLDAGDNTPHALERVLDALAFELYERGEMRASLAIEAALPDILKRVRRGS